jgi:hypothetical protein
MMGSRPVGEANEAVIWGSASLLGVLAGVGLAFGLWSQLHGSSEPALLTAAVASLSAGLGLIAVALENIPARLFLVALAMALPIAFFGGGPAFAAISP